MINEIWKEINGYEGYYMISSLGRVKSVDRLVKHPKGVMSRKKGMILRLKFDKGYLRVELNKLGEHKLRPVHRLVAEHFIPNPDNLPEVNHKSGDKSDNSVGNLEWSTRWDNQYHSMDVLKRGAVRIPVVATRISTGEEISFTSVNRAVINLGVVEKSVHRVLIGECSQTKGYHFRYDGDTRSSMKDRRVTIKNSTV